MSEEIIWYGWIPTNRGKLQFSYIDKNNLKKSCKNGFSFDCPVPNHINIKNLNVVFLSDSWPLRFISKPIGINIGREFPMFADIEITDNQYLMHGTIRLSNKQYDVCFNCDFVLQYNGVVRFSGLDYPSCRNYNSEIIEEIKLSFYNILKLITHGDTHHHQKIDIALPITNDTFSPEVISNSILDFIKLTERNTKIINKSYRLLREESLTHEIKGYIAYLRTFHNLFPLEGNKHNDIICLANNIHTSLQSIVDKRITKAKYYDKIKSTVLIFFALFISINILINNLVGIKETCTHLSLFEITLWSFIIVLAIWLIFNRRDFMNLLYYHGYPFFDMIAQIHRAKLSSLNLIGKIIILIPVLFILAGLIVIGIYIP